MATQDPDKLMAKADKLTKLSFTRWNADWKNATALYEQAAVGYRFRKENEKAKEAFEKASKGQEMISSPWDAAKHMESAASIAKELGHWNEVSDFYRKASELYRECGRSQPASDALGKGASALEDTNPDEAVRLYIDACEILEEDGKEQMCFDLYRAVTSTYVKLERYTDAATLLLRWGVAADKCNAVNSQCKAYLSAIIVYLYMHDFQQAQKCYNDCSQVGAFLSSDQGRCASAGNGGKPVILLSHSLGGLFALQLLGRSSIAWRRAYVKHLVALSAPWAGTVQEMLTFASGYTLGIPVVDPLLVRGEQRSSESNLWLLPSPKVFGERPLVVTANRSYSAPDMAEFLEDIGFEEGVRPYKTRILPMVAEELPEAGVPVTCVVGGGVETPERLVYGAAGFDVQPEVEYGDGDGTVNSVSLLALEKAQEEVKVIRLEGISHAGILKDKMALQEIVAEISNVNSIFTQSLAC